jgi:hypothetical protein
MTLASAASSRMPNPAQNRQACSQRHWILLAEADQAAEQFTCQQRTARVSKRTRSPIAPDQPNHCALPETVLGQGLEKLF